MIVYHATKFENLGSILDNGLQVNKSPDKMIYFADTEQGAVNFMAIRLCKDILVIKVDIPESELKESFDHSEKFFKCRAFVYDKDIAFDEFEGLSRYQLK